MARLAAIAPANSPKRGPSPADTYPSVGESFLLLSFGLLLHGQLLLDREAGFLVGGINAGKILLGAVFASVHCSLALLLPKALILTIFNPESKY